jgi:hypothetical protein
MGRSFLLQKMNVQAGIGAAAGNPARDVPGSAARYAGWRLPVCRPTRDERTRLWNYPTDALTHS